MISYSVIVWVTGNHLQQMHVSGAGVGKFYRIIWTRVLLCLVWFWLYVMWMHVMWTICIIPRRIIWFILYPRQFWFWKKLLFSASCLSGDAPHRTICDNVLSTLWWLITRSIQNRFVPTQRYNWMIIYDIHVICHISVLQVARTVFVCYPRDPLVNYIPLEIYISST